MRPRLWIIVIGAVLALAAMVWWSRPGRLRGEGAAGEPATQPVVTPAVGPASRPADGTAVVQGRVVDAAGQPIAGARVVAAVAGPPGPAAQRLERRDGGVLGVYRGPLPFADEVAGPASAPGSAPASTVAAPVAGAPGVAREVGATTSRADGTFLLAGLPATQLVLRVTHADYPCSQRLTVSLEGGGERSGVRVALARGVVVTGRVTNRRGVPVARAVVAPELADSVGAESDATGAYRFGPVCGAVRLVASAPGLRSQGRSVATAAADREARLDFRLEPDGESLRGRVLDHRERPAVGVRVTATSAAAGRPPVSAVSGGRGEFVLGGLGPGPYRLETRHEVYPALVREGVQPGEDLTLRLAAAGAIAGLVRDERAGAGVPRYQVTLAARAGLASPTVRHNGARFEARPLAAGRWRVTVRAPGYATFARDVEVRGGEHPGTVAVTDLLVELRRGAVAVGEVRDERGDRVAGATISLGGQATQSDARGAFRLGDLPDGEQVLRVKQDGHEPTEVPVRLRAGDETRGLLVTLRRRP